MSNDAFREALKAGQVKEAFVLALSEAVELKIITRVTSGAEAREEIQPSDSNLTLETRINLGQGTIESEMSDRLLHQEAYQNLQSFHLQQIKASTRLARQNLDSLHKLFSLWLEIQKAEPSVSAPIQKETNVSTPPETQKETKTTELQSPVIPIPPTVSLESVVAPTDLISQETLPIPEISTLANTSLEPDYPLSVQGDSLELGDQLEIEDWEDSHLQPFPVPEINSDALDFPELTESIPSIAKESPTLENSETPSANLLAELEEMPLQEDVYFDEELSLADLAADLEMPSGEINIEDLTPDFGMPSGEINIEDLTPDLEMSSGEINLETPDLEMSSGEINLETPDLEITSEAVNNSEELRSDLEIIPETVNSENWLSPIETLVQGESEPIQPPEPSLATFIPPPSPELEAEKIVSVTEQLGQAIPETLDSDRPFFEPALELTPLEEELDSPSEPIFVFDEWETEEELHPETPAENLETPDFSHQTLVEDLEAIDFSHQNLVEDLETPDLTLEDLEAIDFSHQNQIEDLETPDLNLNEWEQALGAIDDQTPIETDLATPLEVINLEDLDSPPVSEITPIDFNLDSNQPAESDEGWQVFVDFMEADSVNTPTVDQEPFPRSFVEEIATEKEDWEDWFSSESSGLSLEPSTLGDTWNEEDLDPFGKVSGETGDYAAVLEEDWEEFTAEELAPYPNPEAVTTDEFEERVTQGGNETNLDEILGEDGVGSETNQSPLWEDDLFSDDFPFNFSPTPEDELYKGLASVEVHKRRQTSQNSTQK